MGKTMNSRPVLRVHYRKLVDDYGGKDTISFQPPLPDYLQYCCRQCGHRQNMKAEELNSIVGNAFRMAYAAQLQRQPSFHDVISSQLTDKAAINPAHIITWPKQIPGSVNDNMDPNINLSSSQTLLLHKSPPSSIPGLRPYHTPTHTHTHSHSDSTHSTPSSEESNSPTDLNSYKRLGDKPPLIKRLAVGLVNSPSEENNAVLCLEPQPIKHLELEHNRLSQSSPSGTETDLKVKRISGLSSSSSSVSGSAPSEGLTPPPPPPPPPERTDSLTNKPEDGELKAAPWFQAGIPREITLEVLGQEPEGAFMVRESTSKPGCFALSLRVPREFQPLGIAHYLILRTSRGYKIKGFTKEFSTLTALITHHSVMPELLPCPLSLSRYNPSFVKSDSNRDFADIDSDPDYNTLADFRKMMADLNV